MPTDTVNKLLDVENKLTYKVLTDKDTYYVGTAKFDWITSEVVDHFRVGPNIEGEFCIEDSIGRFIPFALEDIDALIDVLLTYRQENDKDVEILNLQARVRELEDDAFDNEMKYSDEH
jgi:hypothetical protein